MIILVGYVSKELIYDEGRKNSSINVLVLL